MQEFTLLLHEFFYKKHTIPLMRQNDHHKYNKLREQFPFFRYVNYAYEKKDGNLHVKFTFDISGKYTFNPTLELAHKSFYRLSELSDGELDNIVFHIGMVELISYWKLTCSPKVIVEPHQLSRKQVEWWKKLYLNGLGEFFYLNGITPDPDEFMQIRSNGTKTSVVTKPLDKAKVLIPIGGGKDSVVTLELLKNTPFEIHPMMLNPREASVRTVEIAGYDLEQSVTVSRTLDPLMLELNQQGFLNGHTPFSALLAFVSVLTATVSGAGYVALSNENSANESTVPGTNINHQYSKSFEFEEDFKAYCREYLHPDLHYFSFLRPLTELQIAKLFAGFPQHFDSFRSCNVGSKKDVWCGKCPKCLFTQIILSPYVKRDRLQHIFRADLLDDISLKPVFEELTGVSPVKPFECVGTPDEINTAIAKAYGNTEQDSLPVLLKNYKFPANGDQNFNTLVRSFNCRNLLPAPFLKVLLSHLKVPVEDRFVLFLRSKFGPDPGILILGFGREGQSTYKILRRAYPDLTIHIADRNEAVREMDLVKEDAQVVFHLGEDYQSDMDSFTVVIKSPGVKPERTVKEVPLSSQTDLFLEFFGDQTIGVTGTKGKSTTSTLIYHLLKSSGRKTLLLGNIGVPPFDLTDSIEEDTLVVFEMSAHQLEYVKHAPHIAVLLNIFPEHLDHFGDFETYREAKYNIFKHQFAKDIAIQHQGFSADVTGRRWLFGHGKQEGLIAYTDGSKLVFAEQELTFELENDRQTLIGKHNLLNVTAALLAVYAAGIPPKEVFKHIFSFRSLPHRLEYVGKYGDVVFFNDSISTVPESTLAAIEALQQVRTLILGGYDRGIDYGQMVRELNESWVEHFIFLGKAGEVMRNGFEELQSEKDLVSVADIYEAVAYALKNTGPGGVCLLSPAAASYDQFHNFEHRGNAFKEALEKYRHKKSG